MNQQPVIHSRKPLPAHGKRGDEPSRRPVGRMVLCLGELAHAAVIERFFQERGWKVHLAASGAEARAHARKCGASVVLLNEEVFADESGWLTGWKLLHERPKTRVIVLGSRPTAQGARLAEFIGAMAYLPSTESACGIFNFLQAAEMTAF